MQNLTPTPNPTSNNDIEQRIAHERIRQARNTSNLALIATALSTLFGLVGATALFTGKIPEGSITTTVGLTSSLHCSRLAKDANDRLDKLIAELDDE
ncbi:MAG: hypothetical protein AAFY72_04980 [Cyanobacteria bacterium J06649_4]